MNLKAATLQSIDEVITHYPSKRSATLPLLHLIQEDVGWISTEAIEWIAQKLELQPINVYEVVTFYPMFRREPGGRHVIKVCRTLSCAMAGSYALREKLCTKVGINPHAHDSHAGGVAYAGPHLLNSPDGKFSIEFVECLASCGTGPVCMVDDDFYEAVDDSKIDQILNKYE